jgi:predicted transcriptional regulator
MDTSTAPIDWRAALRDQGRTIRWLAQATGRTPRTVYAYSQGTRTPTADWLARVEHALGVPVIDERVAA